MVEEVEVEISNEWRESESTRNLVKSIVRAREELKEGMISGGFTAESAETTAILTARIIGTAQAYESILEVINQRVDDA